MLLDVSRLAWRAWEERLPTGIDRTALAYVRHYRARSRAVVQRGGWTSVLSEDASQALFELLLKVAEQSGTPAAGARRALFGLVPQVVAGIGRRGLDGQVYLNVGHTGLDKPGHATWVDLAQVRPIYFVHDLIPLTHPEFCRAEEPRRHRGRMLALLRRGAGVIGNSCDTVNKLELFAERQGLGIPPALVAFLGGGNLPNAGAERADVRQSERPYFVMVGTIEGRKNHLLMLTLWAQLARCLGNDCPQLVIIGQRGWECEQVVDMLERCEAIQGHVVELPSCNDALLVAYMRGARALLFPSFVEGYGLPLVEALAAGTPVIASDLPVFRELAGDIPDYFSPIDGLGWTEAVENYARNESPMRDAQLHRMVGWQPPTWERHFARVDDWLEQFRAQ